MNTEKTQNYTEAQTQELVAGYLAGETVEALATQLGKSTRSIVAKLSREGVYKAKTKASGQPRVKKADLVETLALACGVPSEVFESLEKANLDVLEHLVNRLQ
jgi:hypothetical protein